MKHSEQKSAFGDFQTPLELALQCCQAVQEVFSAPQYTIEPTCGQGAFVIAAGRQFTNSRVLGFEINDVYRKGARDAIQKESDGIQSRTQIKKQDFFLTNWKQQRERLEGRVLFVGNPPWVTNSQLGVLGSKNLPAKSNVDGLRGIDAMTGRSNFDISESIVNSLLGCMYADQDFLAMLIKTATARKVLRQSWKEGRKFSHASIRLIDANASFCVNVDACLLMVAPTAKRRRKSVCYVSESIDKPTKNVAFGWFAGQLVANPVLAAKTDFLIGDDKTPWRSGIKHDVSRVVELSEVDGQIQKQDGTVIRIERGALFPLAKGADVANNRTECENRRLLVTQRSLNEGSDQIASDFPLAYRYLVNHLAEFESRKSSIYRNRDPFALFGVGPYTFQPWKIAICGLYKRLQFTILGPVAGQPVVTDVTCYTLSFDHQRQAEFVKQLLDSKLAIDFFQARIFWDAKRPITAEVLRKLNLRKLAIANDRQTQYEALFSPSIDPT